YGIGYHFPSGPFHCQHCSTPTIDVIAAPILLVAVVVNAPVGITQNCDVCPLTVAAVPLPATPTAPLPVNVHDVIAFAPEIFVTGPAMFVAPATLAVVANEAPNGSIGLLNPGCHVNEFGLQYHCAPLRILTHGETTTLASIHGTFERKDIPPGEPSPPGSCV